MEQIDENPGSETEILRTYWREEKDPTVRALVPPDLEILPTIGKLPRFSGQPDNQIVLAAATIHMETGKAIQWRAWSSLHGAANEDILHEQDDGGGLTVISVDTEARPNELLTHLHALQRRLEATHGRTASIVFILKTDPYGHLPMVLFGESPTNGIGEDLRPKVWVEGWHGLSAYVETAKDKAKKYIKDVEYVGQMGKFAAATQPTVHLHPVERIHDTIPERAKEHYSRVENKESFNGQYLNKLIAEVFLGKLQDLVDKCHQFFEESPHSLPQIKPYLDFVEDTLNTYFNVSPSNGEYLAGLKTLVENTQNNHLETFLQLLDPIIKIEETTGENCPNPHTEELKSHLAACTKLLHGDETTLPLLKKIAYWKKNNNNISFPKSRLLFTAAFLNKIKPSLERELRKAKKSLPKNVRDKIEVKIDTTLEQNNRPAIRIIADSDIWTQHGQIIDAAISKTMNKFWGEIYRSTSEYGEPGDMEKDKIYELFGLKEELKVCGKNQIKLEESPGFTLNENRKNAEEISENNLIDLYYASFRDAQSDPELHNEFVCPRAFHIKYADGKIHYDISPIFTYEPILPEKTFEQLLGPYKLFKERIDARLGKLSNGLIVKKTGGEDLMEPRIIIQRDKYRDKPGTAEMQKLEADVTHWQFRLAARHISNTGLLRHLFLLYLKEYLAENHKNEEEMLSKIALGLFEKGTVVPSQLLISQNFEEETQKLLNQKLSSVLNNEGLNFNTEEITKVQQTLTQAMLYARGKQNEVRSKVAKEEITLFYPEIRQILNENRDKVRKLLEKIAPKILGEGAEGELIVEHITAKTASKIFDQIIEQNYKLPNEKDLAEKLFKFVLKNKKIKNIDIKEVMDEIKDGILRFSQSRYLVHTGFRDVISSREMDENTLTSIFLLEKNIAAILGKYPSNQEKVLTALKKRNTSFFRSQFRDVSNDLRRMGRQNSFYQQAYETKFKKRNGRSALPTGNTDLLKKCPINLETLEEFLNPTTINQFNKEMEEVIRSIETSTVIQIEKIRQTQLAA